MVQDSTNLLMFQRQQRDYDALDHEEKKKHRESTIRPVNINTVNDSTTVYTYYNTYNPNRHNFYRHRQIRRILAGGPQIDIKHD